MRARLFWGSFVVGFGNETRFWGSLLKAQPPGCGTSGLGLWDPTVAGGPLKLLVSCLETGHSHRTDFWA